MNKIGFDNDKYVATQSEQIKKRIASFGGKLYLEFGGKLFDDYHASRVLPGFLPDSKMKMLMQLKDQAEVVIVINAGDIEKNKIRGDLGITYADDTVRLIDVFRSHGLFVGSVVLTQFSGQRSAEKFEKRLQNLGIRTYRHYPIDGYPANTGHIVSDEVLKLDLLMNKVGCTVNDRPPVAPALDLAKKTGAPACAMELGSGQIVTGKTSPLLGACSAVLLNALKAVTGIDDAVLLIAPQVIEPVQKLKTEHLGNKNPRLHTDEVLIALAVSAVHDANAKKALDGLKYLSGCELHATVMLSPTDEKVLKKLGIRLTSEPVYQKRSLCTNKQV